MDEKDELLLIPHGNLQSELFEAQKKLFSLLEEKFSFLHPEILFCKYALLCSSGKNDVDEMKNQFSSGQKEIFLSGPYYSDGIFYVRLNHILLDEEKNSGIKFLPQSNSFNLVKVDEMNCADIASLLEKIGKIEGKIRVFQLAKGGVTETFDCGIKSLQIEMQEKKWVKIF